MAFLLDELKYLRTTILKNTRYYILCSEKQFFQLYLLQSQNYFYTT